MPLGLMVPLPDMAMLIESPFSALTVTDFIVLRRMGGCSRVVRVVTAQVLASDIAVSSV